ncbi:MAG: efflux RND transporter permease subunit, partial [Bacteroidota bacterium]
DTKPGLFDRLGVYYKNMLSWVLKRSWLSLGIIVATFIFALSLFGTLPFIFFPDSDRNLITLDLNLPLGTKVERTDEVVKEIEQYIDENLQLTAERTAGVVDYATFISEGPKSYDLGYQPGEANSGYAHMLINTSSFEDNQMVADALDNFAFENLPDTEVNVGPLAGGGGGGSDVEIRLSGDNPKELYRIAQSIKQQLNSLPRTKNIKDDWGPQIKKFVIDINQDNANRAGVTNQDIAISLSTALSGYDAGAFRDGEDNIPIMMRNQRSQEMSATELGTLPIFAQSSGQNVPLDQVATIQNDWQLAKIKRRNLYRTMVISCDARTGVTASDITNEILPWLATASQSWSPNYTYKLGGESEESAEAMGAVGSQLPLAGFIILLLLVIQFNSFRKTGIVLSTIPLGVIGVIFGLILFRSYFGFMAFLGVISLAGIVINNAIVLIDRIQIEQDELGKPPYKAILDAAQQRFRPILLTTFTTTLGMIPLYLGGGLMWEPMAISIMIGLLFATIITLLFVPVMYKLLFRVSQA